MTNPPFVQKVEAWLTETSLTSDSSSGHKKIALLEISDTNEKFRHWKAMYKLFRSILGHCDLTDIDQVEQICTDMEVGQSLLDWLSEAQRDFTYGAMTDSMLFLLRKADSWSKWELCVQDRDEIWQTMYDEYQLNPFSVDSIEWIESQVRAHRFHKLSPEKLRCMEGLFGWNAWLRRKKDTDSTN